MVSLDTIVSILSFILNSVLLSGFIIPQAQKLKEIKDRIMKYKITYIPDAGLSFPQVNSMSESQRKDVTELQELLDIYRIRSNELSAVVRVFYVAIVLALGSLLIILIFGDQKIESRFINLSVSQLTVYLHAVLQIAILIWAIRTYATHPNQLQDARYLVKEMEINPYTLISALGLKLSLDSGKFGKGGQKKEDPLMIILSMNLRVTGFRFLYIVAGQDGKVYFVSFGPITAKTQLWRHLVAPNKFRESGEYNWIELGSFQFNLIKQQQALDVTFLVFLPFFKQEKLSPLVGQLRLDVYGKDSDQMHGAVSGGMGPIIMTQTLKDIIYRGEGTRIDDLKYTGDETKALKKIIDRFGGEIAKSRKIKQYSEINGNVI
jgi:hypothetical protein